MQIQRWVGGDYQLIIMPMSQGKVNIYGTLKNSNPFHRNCNGHFNQKVPVHAPDY